MCSSHWGARVYWEGQSAHLHRIRKSWLYSENPDSWLEVGDEARNERGESSDLHRLWPYHSGVSWEVLLVTAIAKGSAWSYGPSTAVGTAVVP